MSYYADRLRRDLLSERFGDDRECKLGNGNGKVVLADGSNLVWVRELLGANDDGSPRLSPPFSVRKLPNINFYPAEGQTVWVGLDRHKQLAVKDVSWESMTAQGISTNSANAYDPRTKFNNFETITELYAQAIGTTNSPSTSVNVMPFRYIDDYNQLKYWGGGQISLASLIPATDLQRCVLIYLKPDLTLVAYGSTTQSLFTPMDATDIQECINQRAADAIPVALFKLANGQVSVTDKALSDHYRQFMNTPPAVGFPYEMRYQFQIRQGYSVVQHGGITISGNGGLTVNGGLWLK